MMKKMRVLLAAILSLHVSYVSAIVIGSTSAVSLQPLATFPAADNDNTMLGFGWFGGGFTLENNTTTCTFNSVYPVAGPINLNGGTLFLNQDLLFKNITTLQSLGSIMGNNFAVQLCESINNFPATPHVFENVNIYMSADLTLSTTVIFRGNCVLSGNTNSLFMGSGAILVDSGSHLTMCDIEIQEINNQNIRCADDSATLLLDGLRWIQNGDFSFQYGSIAFKDPIQLIGAYNFFYESSQTSTITQNTTVQISDGMLMNMGRYAATGNQPLVGIDSTSILNLDNCSFIVTPSGITLASMTLSLNRTVDVDVQSTTTENGLIIGDGNGNDCAVYLTPGTAINLIEGYVVFNNVNPNNIISTSATAQVIRQQNSLVAFNQNTVLHDITLQLVSDLSTPLEIQTNSVLEFDNVSIVLPDIEFQITGYQYGGYAYLLDGNQDLFITKGTMPLGLVVSGPGNTLRGNGGITESIVLTDTGASLLFGLQGFVSSTIVLNGGTMALETNLQLLASGQVDGPGTLNIADNVLVLSGGMAESTTPIYFESANGILSLTNNISLSETWTFNGWITIDGGGNFIDLSEGGSIVIDSDSHVRFKNMRILGIQNGNVSCVDDTGSFQLDDVDWIQDGSFTFSFGSFDILNQVNILGNSTFAYASDLTSTIHTNSELHITDNMTLQIGASPVTFNPPISFEDKSAILHLDNCGFNITSPGYQMTKGTIFLDRNILIDMNATSTSTGLILGNGNPDDDITIYVSPSVIMNYNTGYLTYNNASPDGFVSASNTAIILRFEGSNFYAAKTVGFSNITSALSSELVSAIVTAPGASLVYDDITVKFPGAEFDITGVQPTGYEFLLNTNDNLNMLRGDLPFALLVAGPGNLIQGNGTLLSPLIFTNPAAVATWGAMGGVSDYISLGGGTLALTSDLFLAAGAVIYGPGEVNLGDRRLRLAPQSTTWTSPLYWYGSGGVVDMKTSIGLAGVWTFSGNCTLDGRGNTVMLQPGGQISVAPDSTLTLNNITLQDVQGNNIQCVDNTGSIILNNVIWKQSNDAQFTAGSLVVSQKVLMTGAGTTFAYQSPQASTIDTESVLKLDVGFTFSYDPNINAKNLIQFTDFTSKLVLNGATFHATGTGVQFTIGEIDIRRNSIMSSEIIGAYDEGITMGDGNGDDDCTCIIGNGAQLYITQGSFNYNNVNDSSWEMLGNQSKLRMASGTTLTVFENLDLNDGVLMLEDSTTFAVAIGVNVIGSVHPLGSVTAYEFQQE